MSRTQSPCPPWCEEDHERFVAHERLTGATVRLYQWEDEKPELTAYVHAAQISAEALGMVTAANAREARRLALFAENMADMEPDRIRDFAAQIREAAAQAWPEPEAG